MAVEEGVAGPGIFLDVVRNPGALERRLELRGGAAERAVLTAVARDDRAGAAERVVEVLREVRVVRRRDVEAAAGQGEREAAAHAEADDAGLAGAVLADGEPAPDGVDVVERLAVAARERAERRLHALQVAAGGVQVGRHREV